MSQIFNALRTATCVAVHGEIIHVPQARHYTADTLHGMTLRQKEFKWPELPDRVSEAVQEISEYTSLKIVSLLRIGSMEKRYSILKPADAKRFFRDYWEQNPGNDQERFVVACLNIKNVVQSVVTVTIGTLQNSLVHPREVFKPAVIEGSAGIIVSHNHPSGNPTPSDQDRKVTDRLREAGEILGINVLDHIIHGDGTGEMVSLMEDL